MWLFDVYVFGADGRWPPGSDPGQSVRAGERVGQSAASCFLHGAGHGSRTIQLFITWCLWTIFILPRRHSMHRFPRLGFWRLFYFCHFHKFVKFVECVSEARILFLVFVGGVAEVRLLGLPWLFTNSLIVGICCDVFVYINAILHFIRFKLNNIYLFVKITIKFVFKYSILNIILFLIVDYN